MPLYALDGTRPELALESYVAPTAVLIGRVRLEHEASVWWNAVLRGDNEWITLGKGTNVQDGVVCHTDMGSPLTLGEGVTVGHSAILHGCTVEDHTLIGMQAVILNDAVIGPECIIGAGALVAQGKTIPPRSLVLGSPGRVVRQLGVEEIASVRDSAKRYVANWRRYAAGCEPV